MRKLDSCTAPGPMLGLCPLRVEGSTLGEGGGAAGWEARSLTWPAQSSKGWQEGQRLRRRSQPVAYTFTTATAGQVDGPHGADSGQRLEMREQSAALVTRVRLVLEGESHVRQPAVVAMSRCHLSAIVATPCRQSSDQRVECSRAPH